MEEISNEDINELETQLYSTLHYDYAFTSTPEESNNELLTFCKTQPQRYWKNPASVHRTLLNAANKQNTNKLNIMSSELDGRSPGVITYSNQQPKYTSRKQKLHTENDRNEDEDTSRVNEKQKSTFSQKHVSKQRCPEKNDPLTQKINKLSKILLLRRKRRKAQRARKRSGQTIIDTINLDSSCDEAANADDVILVPPPPPITINIDASDDERSSIVHEIPLNARDSSFALPHRIAEDSIHCDAPSRCTSPCSVSTDDFIGAHDRTRLNQPNNLGADDEDIREVLGEDDEIQIVTQSCVGNTQNNKNCTENIVNDESMLQSKITNLLVDKEKRTLEQEDIGPLEEYENEKDMAQGVYSKDKFNSKSTTIRSLSSSSDEEDYIIPIRSNLKEANRSQKLIDNKHKKELDLTKEREIVNSENCKQSHSTGVAFISRGIAVERCGSLSQASLKRRTSLSNCSSGQMSDHEFISTLNNLAQGDTKNLDESEVDSEDENAPSARDIVEKVINSKESLSETTLNNLVQEHTKNMDESEVDSDDANAPSARDIVEKVINSNESLSEETALPESAIKNMDAIIHSIDKMDSSVETTRRSPDFTTVISDSADSNDSFNESSAEKMFDSLDKNLVTMETVTCSTTTNQTVEDPVYNIIYNRSCNFNCGIGWDEEMRRFYNDTWKGETFNIKEIWRGLESNKKFWKIYTDDRFPKERRNSNFKCSNCCEFGHTRAKCKRPKKPSICFMCGERGHYEPRCPNTLCLRCGRKTRVFTKSCNSCTYHNRLICPVCKIRGHSLNLCPDKWRRYHSTIEPNAHPSSNMKYNPKKYCCICGRRGHLSETCNSAVRFMEYPIIVSDIKSHTKTYSDQAITSPSIGIAYNLLYKPQKEYSFDLANNTMKDKCYGRFLKAVGMEYMLKRKRRLSNICTQSPENDDVTKPKRIARSHSVDVQSSVMPTTVHTFSTAPEQVQEISKSGISDVEESTKTKNPSDINTCHIGNIITNKITDNTDNIIIDNESADAIIRANHYTASHATNNQIDFKTPSKTQFHVYIGDNTHGDSDSNYSFSDHFDRPTYERQTIASHSADPLPDFIPLSENDLSKSHILTNNAVPSTGISHCFISSDTDDERDKLLQPSPEMPCEAKIYLTNVHSKFLLSPCGNNFLVEQSKKYDIKARLDCLSVGHVLVVFGLPRNQDSFHHELLNKYREITDQLNSKRNADSSQKVPKRVDVLIRFLRENINQLFNNLGNVHDLLKKLQISEKQQSLSKTGFKLVEKLRRSLNMILLGQAGLLNGDQHISELILSLKTLINDFNGEEYAPLKLRTDIESHWRVIFTPYRHDNYPKIVDAYNLLLVKNRILQLKIDPYLLGQKVLHTALPSEQNEDMQKANTSKPAKNFDKKRPCTITNRTTTLSPPPPPPSMKIEQFSTDKTTRDQNEDFQNVSTWKSTKNFDKKWPVAITNRISQSPPPPSPSMKIQRFSTGKTTQEYKDLQRVSTLKPTKNFDKKCAGTITKRISQSPPPPSPSMKIQQLTAKTTPAKHVHNTTTNSSQKQQFEFKSTIATSGNCRLWESNVGNIFTQIEGANSTDKNTPKAKATVSKGPSMFWSRESIRYLDECINLAECNLHLLQKLQRIQSKSYAGQLSYNDYRAVIRLHSTMLGK